MALEPLAIAIRSNQGIEGVKVRNNSIKVGLYADDIVCYLTNLMSSINSMNQTLLDVSVVSGYKKKSRENSVDGASLHC